MKKFNGYCMKGVTAEDNREILKHEDYDLHIDEHGRVWTHQIDGVYIADAVEADEGDGVFCK